MIHKPLNSIAAALVLSWSLVAFADSTAEGWNWNIGCPGDGTLFAGGGTFGASNASGFSGAGTCARTGTHFTRFNFTSSAGGIINTSVLYAVHTNDWLIIPPTLSSEIAPVYAVATACPQSNKSLNWIFVQWDSNTRTMTDTYVMGTGSYSPANGVYLTGEYDVTGRPYWIDLVPMPGSCSGGIVTTSGNPNGADLDGTIFFAMDGSGVFKSTPGHATFFFPQYPINASADLGSLTFQGMTFDSFKSQDARNVTVSSSATGMAFTVSVYLDPSAGTIDPSYTDSITLSAANFPQNGMMTGTVTRKGAGAAAGGGSGNIACIVSKSLDTRIICSGQSPSNNSYPYTVAFVLEGLHVLGQQTTMSDAGVTQSLNNPFPVFSDGTRLYVGEYSNSRVLIWNSIPTSSDRLPDVVLGQPNFNSAGVNTGGLSAQSMSGPLSIYSDGTKLFVADSGNNRVLQWNTIPTVNFTPASVVLGQPDMTSNSSNNGGISSQTLSAPRSVVGDGTRVYVGDIGNNRLLIWNTAPAENQAAANVVLGQPDWTSNSANNGGVSSSSLSSPMGSYSNGIALYVSDQNNNRILIWNSIPTSNQTPANLVLGQPDMTSSAANNGGISSSSLNYPRDVQSDGTRLYVADYNNSRFLIWNTMPTTTGAAASIEIGQTGMTSAVYNYNGVTSKSLSNPSGISSDGTRVFGVDRYNNRILIWNTVPTANNAAADIVLGQPDMTSGLTDNAGVSATSFNVNSATTDGTRLYLADAGNNRVLIWNSVPTANDTAPDIVLGQPDFTTTTANNGGLSASSLAQPYFASSDGTKLYVSDTANSRILVWNSIPTASQTGANMVLGAPDMTSTAGGLSAQTFTPMSAISDGTRLVVADYGNYRVLIYNTIPTVNYASADIVLGQPDMTSRNIGGPTTSQNVQAPRCAQSDGTRLYVTDYLSNRVLVWNSIPTINGASADVVLGQPDMTSNTTNNGGVSGSSMYNPIGVFSDGTQVFVADSNNNRVLVWSTIPTSNGVAASAVLGQINLTSNAADSGGMTGQTLSAPRTVYSDGLRVYITDTGNQRVILMPVP